MLVAIIRDEDLTYQGRTLSAWYEEERLQAIRAAKSQRRGRPTVNLKIAQTAGRRHDGRSHVFGTDFSKPLRIIHKAGK